MLKIDLTCKSFGDWTVLRRDENTSYSSRWICRCKCGREVSVYQTNLTTGKSKSCGCSRPERIGARSLKHGMSMSTEYVSWLHMKSRCYSENNESFPDYGGRGIKVSDEWKSNFSQFFSDMGPKPSPGHTLDRIDVNGDYSKDNCRWSTMQEQAANRRTRK